MRAIPTGKSMNGNTKPESLLRLLVHLFIGFVITWILAGVFMRPFPPGGVAPPFFGVILLIPWIVFKTAPIYPRWSVPICYGAITGAFFGYILFVGQADDRTFGSDYSLIPIEMRRILWFAAGVVAVCLLSFALSTFLRRRTAPPK